ncbi:MAG TPA: CTP synthase (glutamine hydrolyzing) [Candidatus Binatia bacterium]|nr:CTP synthase (glutamine hydrolyzing) [Candidatus Binatia bacterium]
MHQTKFIVVTGGVLSGLGKGTATASIGRLIRGNRKIVTVKCDGYLNVDPGTMNPIEHGEVFVLHDGGEVDMDFGHYERFLDINCKFGWNLTSGKIFNSVIQRERKGDFLGKTIQIFPHVVNEVKAWWKRIIDEEKPDVMMIEIGGTVGDIENSWYIWAAQQLRKIVGPENIFYIHLTYVPFLDNVGELKAKPAQRDIALLREKGIFPDAVICRAKTAIPRKIKDKLALLCDMEPEQFISGRDIDNIYEIPILFKQEGMLKLIQDKFKFDDAEGLGIWETLVNNLRTPKCEATIAICGKYTELRDSYASVIEALTHAGAHIAAKVHLRWIETTDIEEGRLTAAAALAGADGVLVPGGFGGRGAEGKISVIQFARENKIPYLGICYGLQLAVIEFARNVCRLPDANTTEVNPATQHPVIDILPEQREVYLKGGTMRLGASKNDIKPDTLAAGLYNTSSCWERHRHRYEVNPEYHAHLAAAGMTISATSQNGRIAEFIELSDHPFFFASQAHNELTSRLERPNPAFAGFVRACCKLPPVTNEALAERGLAP